MNWLKQLFCTHSTRSYVTTQISDTTTRTTGGCDRCGKLIAHGCERCGK